MANPGIGSRTANDVLIEAGLQLVEPYVNTSLAASVSTGVQTVAVASTAAMYVGAEVVVDTETPQEVITLTAVTPTTITATFAKAHASGSSVVGATFPIQQPTDPLFTQQEMLGYLARAQNEFLAMVPLFFQRFFQTVQAFQIFQATPPTTIEIDRVASAGVRLYEQTQEEITLANRTWRNNVALSITSWFEDRTGLYRWGVGGKPGSNFPVELLCGIRDTDTLALTDGFLVPDTMIMYVRYGVLSYAFSKAGERRNPEMAKHANDRFIRGAATVARWLGSEGAQPGARK